MKNKTFKDENAHSIINSESVEEFEVCANAQTRTVVVDVESLRLAE